jgi:hypothetical protein
MHGVYVTVLCQLAQCYGERFNHFQIIMGLYYLACGTPRRQFDVLAHAGLTVSYAAALKYLRKTSDESRERAIEVAHTEGGDVVWDNINMAFRVSEQRLDSVDTFENGTTATLLKRFCREGVARGSLKIGLLPLRSNRRPVYTWDLDDTMPNRNEIFDLKLSLEYNVRSILLDWHKPLKEKYIDKLGPPPTSRAIPLHKTEQYPLAAIRE